MSDTTTTHVGLRERNKERRRSTILQCAFELFAEQGYNATTIAEIAAAADIAPRTVSLYFPTKQDIVLEGVTALIYPLMEAIDRLEPGESVIEVILEVLRKRAKERRNPNNDHMPAKLKADPEIFGIVVSTVERLEQTGTRAIAREIGCAPDDPRVTITLAATRSVLEHTMFATSEAEIDQYIDYGKLFLQAGMRQLSDTKPGKT